MGTVTRKWWKPYGYVIDYREKFSVPGSPISIVSCPWLTVRPPMYAGFFESRCTYDGTFSVSNVRQVHRWDTSSFKVGEWQISSTQTEIQRCTLLFDFMPFWWHTASLVGAQYLLGITLTEEKFYYVSGGLKNGISVVGGWGVVLRDTVSDSCFLSLNEGTLIKIVPRSTSQSTSGIVKTVTTYSFDVTSLAAFQRTYYSPGTALYVMFRNELEGQVYDLYKGQATDAQISSTFTISGMSFKILSGGSPLEKAGIKAEWTSSSPDVT